MKTVVVLPTFNEKENIARLISEIFKIVPEVFVLVVDDNSPDGTAKIVEGLKEKYPRLSLLLRKKKEGLGKAYLHGFSETLKEKGVERIVMMDADFSHAPAYLPSMLEASKKYDLVIGSRYIKSGGTVGWELWRRLLSRGGNIYCRLVLGMPISDFTTGFSVLNAKLLRRIDLFNMDLSGYAFLIELKYRLWKAGASVKEIPIIFKNRTDGKSKLSGHIIGEGVLGPWKMILKKTKGVQSNLK